MYTELNYDGGGIMVLFSMSAIFLCLGEAYVLICLIVQRVHLHDEEEEDLVEEWGGPEVHLILI